MGIFGFFSDKSVDVEFYLGRIRHELASNIWSKEKSRHYAMKIESFLEEYIRKRENEIEQSKFSSLKKTKEHLKEFIQSCNDGKSNDEMKKVFDLVMQNFLDYASNGSVYILRHPDKSKEGRSLSSKGVEQSKKIAEMIKEEILLSPKKTKVIISTSEIKRTKLFAQIIKQVNNAGKTGKKIDISVHEDPKLFMGPISEEVYKILEQLIKDHGKVKGDYLCFQNWIGKKGGFDEVIQKGGFADPDKVKKDIDDFSRHGERLTNDKDSYNIIIGISHSWIIDVWLMKYLNVDSIIDTAEFAKIEKGTLNYRKATRKIY